MQRQIAARSLFLIFIIPLISGCTDIKRLRTYMVPPSFYGMEQVAPHLFVNCDMPVEQREEITKLVPEAKKRVAAAYGDVKSAPDILACSTDACYKRIGGYKARALTLGKFGRYKLLISPKGLSTPLLAHEWSHAELGTRVGMGSVPHWFDEGLAVAVSEEPSHSEEVWQQVIAAKLPTPKLEDLVSLRQWLKAARAYGDTDFAAGVTGRLCVVYATAGHEVRRWQRHAGSKGLLLLIDGIRAGKKFDSLYEDVEKTMAAPASR